MLFRIKARKVWNWWASSTKKRLRVARHVAWCDNPCIVYILEYCTVPHNNFQHVNKKFFNKNNLRKNLGEELHVYLHVFLYFSPHFWNAFPFLSTAALISYPLKQFPNNLCSCHVPCLLCTHILICTYLFYHILPQLWRYALLVLAPNQFLFVSNVYTMMSHSIYSV